MIHVFGFGYARDKGNKDNRTDEKTNSPTEILQKAIRIIDERKQKDDLSKFLKSLENKKSSTKTLSN